MPSVEVATVELVRGAVDIRPSADTASPTRLGNDRTPLSGTAIARGTTITTSDETAGGRIALRLADGQSLRIDQGSRVELTERGALILERGAVYVDTAEGGARVEIRTVLGVVSDIGTQFEVRLAENEGALRVRVREGKILLQPRTGQEAEAEAGEEIELASSGKLRRRSVPVYGSSWDWVLRTAPTPPVDGRRLTDFLAWAAREGGWTILYQDDTVRAQADETLLHGEIREMTPQEATAAVLRGSGLRHRLQGGVLMVEAGP